MAFDPDAYLAGGTATGFDPDAYLAADVPILEPQVASPEAPPELPLAERIKQGAKWWLTSPEAAQRVRTAIQANVEPFIEHPLESAYKMVVPQKQDIEAIAALAKPETYQQNLEPGSQEWLNQVVGYGAAAIPGIPLLRGKGAFRLTPEIPLRPEAEVPSPPVTVAEAIKAIPPETTVADAIQLAQQVPPETPIQAIPELLSRPPEAPPAPEAAAPPPTAGAPTYTVENQVKSPRDNRMRPGVTVFDGPVDNPTGIIEAERLRTGELQVFNVAVEPGLRGTGRGIGLYEKLIDEAKGTPIISDTSVSEAAANAIEGLSRRGHTVEKNPNAVLTEGQWKTPDGTPVFKITGRTEQPSGAGPPPIPPEDVRFTREGGGEPVPPPVPPEYGGPMPSVEPVPGIANRYLEEQIAAGTLPEEALVSGIGTTEEAAITSARARLAKDPNAAFVAARRVTANQMHPGDPALLHAYSDQLNEGAAQARKASMETPGDPQLRAVADTAEKANLDFLQNVLPKAKGQAQVAMVGFQGAIPADLSTFAGMQKELQTFNGGKELTPQHRMQLYQREKTGQRLKAREQQGLDRMQKEIDRTLPRRKIPTREEMQASIQKFIEHVTPCA